MLATRIDKFFKSESLYKGATYSLYEPSLKVGQFCILNTDTDIPDPPYGTHWVGLYRGLNNYYYFDSLGNAPVIKHNNMISNDKQLQPNTSDKCGFWAVSFCLWMSRGNNYNDFINTWTESDFVNIKL